MTRLKVSDRIGYTLSDAQDTIKYSLQRRKDKPYLLREWMYGDSARGCHWPPVLIRAMGLVAATSIHHHQQWLEGVLTIGRGVWHRVMEGEEEEGNIKSTETTHLQLSEFVPWDESGLANLALKAACLVIGLLSNRKLSPKSQIR